MKDATEFMESGAGTEDLEQVRNAAIEIPVSDRTGDRPTAPALALTCARDIQPEKVAWLWPGRIPRGKTVILEGDPGLGKSTLLYDIAARHSTGSPMPDGAPLSRPGHTLILSAEDGVRDTIIPRLMAAGADLDRIHILEGVDQPDGTQRPITLPEDAELLRNAVKETGAELVIVDPLAVYLSPGVNSHRDQDVRRALYPVKEIAEATGAAFIICRHLTKGSAGGNPLYRGGGSIGIIAAARVALIVALDPDAPDSGRVIVACSKSNIGARAPSLAYRIETDPELECSRIAWETGPVHHTANDLCAIPSDNHERGALGEAMDLLREELAYGPRPAKEVERMRLDAGISKATFRRAKERLGVIPERDPGGIGESRAWNWRLPDDLPSTGSPAGVDPEEARRCSTDTVDAHVPTGEHLREAVSTYGGTDREPVPAGWIQGEL